MKKFVFSCLFLSVLAFGAQAQKSSCCKSGSKSASCEAKAPSAVMTTTPENDAAAAKVAASDQTIETRTDPITGTVTYVETTTEATGEVSYVSVNFDPTTNSFVDVAPMNMENCSMKGTSTKGKSCCSMGASNGKSCCSGKSTSAKPAEKTKS